MTNKRNNNNKIPIQRLLNGYEMRAIGHLEQYNLIGLGKEGEETGRLISNNNNNINSNPNEMRL
jgi:hypothetical protein